MNRLTILTAFLFATTAQAQTVPDEATIICMKQIQTVMCVAYRDMPFSVDSNICSHEKAMYGAGFVRFYAPYEISCQKVVKRNKDIAQLQFEDEQEKERLEAEKTAAPDIARLHKLGF